MGMWKVHWMVEMMVSSMAASMEFSKDDTTAASMVERLVALWDVTTVVLMGAQKVFWMVAHKVVRKVVATAEGVVATMVIKPDTWMVGY